MTMSYDTAVIRLRSQVKQLAVAAATTCLQDRMEKASIDHPLMELDQLARQFAAPALEALSVITGDPAKACWPDVPADEIEHKPQKQFTRVIQRAQETKQND
jgi:hypothetical protein